MSVTVNTTSGAIIGNNVTARNNLYVSSVRSNGKPIQFNSNVCFAGDVKVDGPITSTGNITFADNIHVNGVVKSECYPSDWSAPDCTLTTNESATGYLTAYADILPKLTTLDANKTNPSTNFTYGPLILNGGNGGLIDIDVAMSTLSLPAAVKQVFTSNATPTVREGVILTVVDDTIDPTRGNTTEAAVGLSTNSRDIIAARLGNPAGTRMLIITQLHGNEVTGTEGAFRLIHWLTRDSSWEVAQILSALDILIIIRGNPDGGEPTGLDVPLPPGSPINPANFYNTRNNVDPSAGGGFTSLTESGFFGVVAQGYNLNRYMYVDLKTAIRPVECQAVVATALVFQPKYTIDIHGDVPKVTCPLVNVEFIPSIGLSGGLCGPPSLPTPEPQTDRRNSVICSVDAIPETISRAWGARMINHMNCFDLGQTIRFTQIQTGSAVFNNGTSEQIGIVLGNHYLLCEFSTFDKAGFAIVIEKFTAGGPVPGIITGPSNKCYLSDNIDNTTHFMQHAVKTVRRIELDPPQNDGGYCQLPIATGNIAQTLTSRGFPQNIGPLVVEYTPSNTSDSCT
jgi:hypothetical protein